MENSDTCHVHEYMSRLGMCIVCMHACIAIVCTCDMCAQCVPAVLTVALPKLAHVWTAIDCIWRRVVHTLGAFRQLS